MNLGGGGKAESTLRSPRRFFWKSVITPEKFMISRNQKTEKSSGKNLA
jgi:hypothetical protein